jgi:hypothetical protein
MISSLLDAFDLVAHSEHLLLRLDGAAAELSKKQGLKDEKAWLDVARARLTTARTGIADLLTRVLRLPELEPVKEEQARLLQGAAVDAVERLHAGIAFAAGARAPLLEALYGKLKVPVLRRCDREDFEKFCLDFEKRLNTGYARRMFADPSFAVVVPALEQLQQSFATWRGVFSAVPLSESELQALRDELDSVARKLELPCRQARLLAQAALVPLKDLLEDSGLAQKPKRRGSKSSERDEDEHPLLEEDPVDPAEPTPPEQLELSQAHTPPEPPAPLEAEAETPLEPSDAQAPRRGKKSRPTAEA